MHGLTIIAFIGSVFSPYYALARARGRGDPENHVAINVALYGRPRRWAMTERGRGDLVRDSSRIEIGRSAMRWDGDALVIDIDETTVPLPSRLQGRIIVRPHGLTDRRFHLDSTGRHRWHPIAPHCDVEVTMHAPTLSWRGTGYFDTNEGDEPLETGFRSWTWSRFDLADHARIAYDVVERDGTPRALSLTIADGVVEPVPPLPYHPLKTTGWGIARQAPSDGSVPPVLLQTMENAPFYARSAIRSTICGRPANGVHESLSLARVVSPIVRLMLPFRMFRRARSA